MTTIDYEAIAREAGLERVGARASFGAYFKQMWERRGFAISLAKYRVQASMSDNRLGLAWIVLSPLLNAALYGTIFGVIMPRDTRGDEPFIPFLIIGVFIFQFFSKSFSAGAKSITGNASLVRSLNFPRMLLPIAEIIRQVIELIPMIIVMMIIVMVLGVPPAWSWFMIIPIMVCMTMFNLGVALISARLTVHIRDMTQIIPLITRVMFYTTGIFYSLEAVLADQPALLTIAQLNPVHDYVALVRDAVFNSGSAPAWMWWIAGLGGFITLVVGILFFWRAEERYGHD
ncbi:ABC transporter permease [Demequina flava]|uniref:ABC transporter permease n=1 Tax=Demequina flava TaxID=1095025 RepID=UPI000784343B|nr:ABC transporter permease [Demequina flava]